MRAYPSLRGVLAAAVAMAVLLPASASAKDFKLGVAASDVKSSSAILWTRADKAGDVTLQVSTDKNVKGPRNVPLSAKSSNDRVVQVTVKGLGAGKTYFYRFLQGSKNSPIGTFTTPPKPSADRTIRFAFSGDTDAQKAKGDKNIFYDGLKGNNGLGAEKFGIYKRMALEKNDFNVNLGDTIYSDSEVPGKSKLARTLKEKWAKYRMNLAVPNLQKLRASGGIYNSWDDHEFADNFSRPENGNKLFEAGSKAFRTYMPAHYTKQDGLYTSQRWGKNLEIFRLDDRSFRSAKASANHTCDNPDTGQPDYAPTMPQSKRDVYALVVPSLAQPVSQACKDKINDPKRTMLGKRQFDRLTKALRNSKAKFKAVLNQVPIQQQYAFTFDTWETYEAERKRLLHNLQDHGVKNVVFLTTDFHANLVNVIRYRTFEEGGPVNSPYSEFVTGPVSTRTWGNEIDSTTGEGNGNSVDTALYDPAPPTGVGMSCSNLYVYSYAEVKVTSKSLNIVAKDVHGKVVKDQSDDTPCVLKLAAK
jgi:alkaline phosphatase D